MMSKELPIFPDKALKKGFSGRDIPEDSIIQSCVRCGLCLPHCPTYLETFKETSSPRGRIHLMEAVAAGQLGLTDPGFIEQMYQCLDCRACEAVCPSGVQYGKLVEAARRLSAQRLAHRLSVVCAGLFFASFLAICACSDA